MPDLRIQKLAAKIYGVESRVELRDCGHDTRDLVGPILFCVGGGQHNTAKVRARVFAQIPFRLFDRGIVPPFQVVCEAECKAIDRIEFGIEPLREFQRFDGSIGLPRPHQSISAAGERIGVVWVDGKRPVHLVSCLFILVIEDINSAEDDMRSYLRSR